MMGEEETGYPILGKKEQILDRDRAVKQSEIVGRYEPWGWFNFKTNMQLEKETNSPRDEWCQQSIEF